jgi:hypothetical protein
MRSAWVLAFGCLLALSGCAGHTWTMEGVREALRDSDLEEARARLSDAGRGTDDLLFALEDGLLLHYAGDPELSNSRFEFVEQRIDDLYTKSISRAALSLVTSDLVLRFEPHGVESFLVNYYKGLNYLQLDDTQESWVEWRKLASKLQFSREQGDAAYLDPPFFNHLVGLGLETDDPGNAYVAMRLAEAGYLTAERTPPTDLVGDLMRLASALGFADHLDIYRDRYGARAEWPPERMAAGGRSTGASDGDDWGEIVILVEEGLIAPIHEARVYIPITEARSRRALTEGTETQLELAQELAYEYDGGRFDGTRGVYFDGREIAYVLPMSFPVYGLGEALFDRLRVTTAGADTASGRIALDLTELQGEAFADRLLGIYAKTIARALIKYAAAAKLKEKAEEEGGETAGDVVGALANVVNVVTERADTRAWLGLPTRIWMARLRVPPGDHDLQLMLGDGEALVLGPIDVRPLERRLINYRFF